MSAERNPLFIALVEKFHDVLNQAVRLRQTAEAVSNSIIGSVPSTTKVAAQTAGIPPAGTIIDELNRFADQVASEVHEAQEHVTRLLRELPPIPERGPSGR